MPPLAHLGDEAKSGAIFVELFYSATLGFRYTKGSVWV